MRKWEVGDRLGRFTLEQAMGPGVFADYFIARDVQIDRKVWLSVLRTTSPESRALYLEGLRSLAQLDHPGVVGLLHADEIDGVPYAALEYVTGGRMLGELVAEAPLDPLVAIRIVLDSADALAHVHSKGIAHCAVSPYAILVSGSGRAVLSGFGMATKLGAYVGGEPGRPCGVPRYMSPAAWVGAPASTAMDVWSLAIILHEAVTGRVPFVGESSDDWRDEVVAHRLRADARLPAPLVKLLERAWASDEGARIVSVADFRRELAWIESYLASSEATLPPTPDVRAARLLVDVEHDELGVPGRFRIYRLAEKLGEGTFGEVFAAHDEIFGREVALKFLRLAASQDSQAARRFRREAEILSRLAHPNVVRVFNFGAHGGRFFIVMQRLFGRDLAAAMPGAGAPLDAAIAIAMDIAAGLAPLHAAGVVHRDLKPANIMLEADRAIVTDLGVARISDVDQTKLTGTGQLVGTPAYFSPEQVRGLPVSPASDLFSLGVILFEMLTGGRPFPGATLHELLLNVAEATAPLVSSVRPDVPQPLVEITSRLLRRDPVERPGSAGSVYGELASLRGDRTALAPAYRKLACPGG